MTKYLYFAYQTNDHLILDLDDYSLEKAKDICLKLNKEFGSFDLMKTSTRHYVAVFDWKVAHRQLKQVLYNWNRSQYHFFLKHGFIAIRIGWKGKKKPPKLAYSQYSPLAIYGRIEFWKAREVLLPVVDLDLDKKKLSKTLKFELLDKIKGKPVY